MFGIALVVIGAIFLMKNLGMIPGVNWDIVWPMAVLVIGIAMIFKKK
ncbi:MAG: DUF5668 domain-containing protein [Candidatus Buchananbacteria bacterium]